MLLYSRHTHIHVLHTTTSCSLPPIQVGMVAMAWKLKKYRMIHHRYYLSRSKNNKTPIDHTQHQKEYNEPASLALKECKEAYIYK
jgi:hypothetical protein